MRSSNRLNAMLARCGVVAIMVAGAAGAGAQEIVPLPDPIEGTWRTLLQSEVTISRCPEGFCGFLSKIIVPEGMLSGAEADAVAEMRPEDFFDQRNKDPALRNRPMLGLQILTLIPGDKPNVYDGQIYNPEDGNTYSGYMQMISMDQVRLNGCVLFNVICRGEDWVRVPVDQAQ